MQQSIENISGDTEGVTYHLSVYRFPGSAKGAPSAYVQAALHAGELPGVVAVHALMPLLRAAERDGRILGDITIVPEANPIGRAQYLFGDHQGRFHLGTRVNFNREFPLLDWPDPSLIPSEASTPDRQLKALLLKLSLGHDIVLDLHCDDEGLPYLYVPAALWPAMEDCAAAFGADAVLTWADAADGAFEEASIHPYLAAGASSEALTRRVVTTVELRGIADVENRHAASDAAGIYRILVARGVIADAAVERPGPFRGVVAPLDNVEMVKTPKAGAILYDVEPGDRVTEGQRLAVVVHRPGEPDGSVEIRAPQAGTVVTRRATRILRKGDDVLKLAGDRPSTVAKKSGSLEE